MEKVKILETIRQGLVGGGETHVYDLSTHLNKALFEPIVLSFTEGPMVENLRKQGINTFVIPSKIPFDPRVKAKIRKLLVEQEIQLVHAHGSRAASNVVSVAKSLKIPVIYTVHGWSFNDQQRPIVQFLRKKAEAYLTKKVDQVICVSASNSETGKMAIKGLKTVVIDNGISIEKFSKTLDRDLIRSQLGMLSEDEIWVGYIARLTYQKDPINLLKAFKSAYGKNPQLRLLMIGEGDLQEEVAQFISSNEMTSIVKRMPFQSNVPEILAAIDIYSLVSHWEGLPIGLLEAMAARKAIIASNVDGTKEIINHQQNGLLIQNGDAKSLEESLLLLSVNKELRNNFGLAAFETVKVNYSLQSMVEKTENIYKSILF